MPRDLFHRSAGVLAGMELEPRQSVRGQCSKVQPVQRFPQLSTLNPQPQLNPVNSVDFGNQNCTGSGGVRFPGPKNAVFACIGGLGTRFPGAVPNGSRGSQPVSMVQFFPPWPGQLPTPNHPATCIICVSAPVPVHSTFVSLTHLPTPPPGVTTVPLMRTRAFVYQSTHGTMTAPVSKYECVFLKSRGVRAETKAGFLEALSAGALAGLEPS